MLVVHLMGVAVFLLVGTPMERGEDQWRYFTRTERILPEWIWGGFLLYAIGLAFALKTALASAHPVADAQECR